MPANLENSAAATGLEKISFHSNPKEGQCQRMFRLPDVNHELPDVQAGFRKGRGTRDQIANICWIVEKAREFQKNIYFCFIDYAKVFDCVDHNKLWKILKEMGIPDRLTCLLRNLYAGQEETDPDMEKQTGSKLGEEYMKSVYCHPAYLTSMQSTS